MQMIGSLTDCVEGIIFTDVVVVTGTNGEYRVRSENSGVNYDFLSRKGTHKRSMTRLYMQMLMPIILI